MHIFCSEFLGEFENWYATVVNFLSNLKRECTLSVVNFWCNLSRVCALSVSNFWPNLKGVFTLSVLNSWSNLKRIFTLTVVNFCRLTAYTFTQFAVRSPSNERLIGRSNSRSVFIPLSTQHCRSLIAASSTSVLWHRMPAFAGTSRTAAVLRTERKRNALYKPNPMQNVRWTKHMNPIEWSRL